MFERWSDFYLMAGSAAAVLIGLIFVVVSLLQDKSRSSVLSGSRLYMGPVVLGVSFVLVLCGAALTPSIGHEWMSALAGGIAVWGLVRSVMSLLGIRALGEDVHWSDEWCYGAVPALLYLALGAVATGFLQQAHWAPEGLAVVVVAMLALTIRNEWDLITWIAPRGPAGPPEIDS